ncbi:hypothetical protein ACVRZD_09390 [Streptococcus hongkongensis]|nr:hypothetical protein NC01_07170 [Streptococcus uberis]
MKKIDFNVVIAKLATVIPIVVIILNIVINLYMKKPFTTSEYVWSAIGLVLSTYFGFFCKDFSK